MRHRIVVRLGRRPGATLLEILLVVAVIALLAALLFPVLSSARRRAQDVSCVSNMRQLLMAIKLYEGDHGVVPMHGQPTPFWQDQVLPYVKSPATFLCRADPTYGANSQWGWDHPCSFKYALNPVTARMFGGPEPAPRSPLVLDSSHEWVYQNIIGRYDGSIELAPPHRYRSLHYEGAAWDGTEPEPGEEHD